VATVEKRGFKEHPFVHYSSVLRTPGWPRKEPNTQNEVDFVVRRICDCMATKMAAVVCLHRGLGARRALWYLTSNVSTSPARSWWWEPSARVSPLNGFAMQRADAHSEARQCRWPASHPFRGNAPPQPFAAPFGARRFSDQVDKDVEEAKAFLLRLRYSPEVADGIITALRSSGALLPTLYAMAGAWVCLLVFSWLCKNVIRNRRVNRLRVLPARFTKSMFPRQEVGLDAGLATLAKAVEMELATKSGTKKVSFFVKVFCLSACVHSICCACCCCVA
jgi:hypothetical protein